MERHEKARILSQACKVCGELQVLIGRVNQDGLPSNIDLLAAERATGLRALLETSRNLTRVPSLPVRRRDPTQSDT
jgi:hypothetical protein